MATWWSWTAKPCGASRGTQLVGAINAQSGRTLGVEAVASKSNEIPAGQTLLDRLELDGTIALTRLRGLEGVTLRNPLEINAATSKVGTTNSLAGVHDLERKSWVVVAAAIPV
jgi:hypothetical protein